MPEGPVVAKVRLRTHHGREDCPLVDPLVADPALGILIAIGDQIYWDQKSALEHRSAERSAATRAFYQTIGLLDYDKPANTPHNEAAIKAACEPQIAHLYGVMLRSTPAQ